MGDGAVAIESRREARPGPGSGPFALLHAGITVGVGAATAFSDPRAFLLHVMNDASVPIASRIEAAKALLR